MTSSISSLAFLYLHTTFTCINAKKQNTTQTRTRHPHCSTPHIRWRSTIKKYVSTLAEQPALFQNGPTYIHPPSHLTFPSLLSHHTPKIYTPPQHPFKARHTTSPKHIKQYTIPGPPARHNTQHDTPPPYLAQARQFVRLQEKHEMGIHEYLPSTKQLI
jgi:hypothetical protein